mmetsp:Transcript_29501/g.26080  ORF Transcript_29501/g.26080 Transcript_29501/m.26080 type:complete len:98 (+) Transcript_29501:958-1251(+)
MYDNNERRNSLNTDKNVIYFRTKESEFQAMQVDSLEIEFEEKDFMYNLEYNFVIITKPVKYKVNNVKLVEDFDNMILDNTTETILEIMKLMDFEEFI